jgi:hypothetical protein
MKENEKSERSLNQKEDDSLSKTNINNSYLVLDNCIYSVNVTKNKNNEKIFISAKSGEDNNIVNNLCFYENCFSLEELIIKSKPFKLCDTIDDAFNIFIDLIKAQKVFLKKSEYAEEYNPYSILVFVIKVSLPGGQEQEVEFELKPKKMDKDQYINELIKIIEKLHKENEELKYENAIKDDEINLLKRKYCINNNNKYENNKYGYNKNQSYDSKRNVSSSKVLNVTTINPILLNTEYNSLYKYGYNDIHNSTDIHSVINYNTIYNSNNKLMNKNNPNSITCKTLNNMSKTFQSTISSFKRGRLTKTSNDSSDFYENKNTIMSKNNKDKDNNLMRTNGFNSKDSI